MLYFFIKLYHFNKLQEAKFSLIYLIKYFQYFKVV